MRITKVIKATCADCGKKFDTPQSNTTTVYKKSNNGQQGMMRRMGKAQEQKKYFCLECIQKRNPYLRVAQVENLINKKTDESTEKLFSCSIGRKSSLFFGKTKKTAIRLAVLDYVGKDYTENNQEVINAVKYIWKLLGEEKGVKQCNIDPSIILRLMGHTKQKEHER